MKPFVVRPGPIGRLARIALGVLFLRLFWGFATGFAAVVQPGNLALYTSALLGAYSHVLGTVVPPLRDTRRRLALVGLVLLTALGADLALYRDWWGPPLAWMLYALALAGLGILGTECVLAGIMGQTGCESTVIPNLLHRSEPPMVEPCVLWDPIDRWEQRLWQRGREDR